MDVESDIDRFDDGYGRRLDVVHLAREESDVEEIAIEWTLLLRLAVGQCHDAAEHERVRLRIVRCLHEHEFGLVEIETDFEELLRWQRL